MNYITGKMIRDLREKKKLTQKQLADHLMVSDKTISKWETGRGLPDIAMIQDIADALQTSITELLTGENVSNDNISANLRQMHFYVCPICGNIITAVGKGEYHCCGILLPELEPENLSALDATEITLTHTVQVEPVENEWFVTISHPMTKEHYISYIAFVTNDSVDLKKLYPQQEASCRVTRGGHGTLYVYCNRHGLFRMTL